jgi:hypothetical protein
MVKRIIIIPLVLISLLSFSQEKKLKKFKGSDLITVVTNTPADSLYTHAISALLAAGYSINRKDTQYLTFQASKYSINNYTHKITIFVQDSLIIMTGEAIYGGWAFPVSYLAKFEIAHVGFEEMDILRKNFSGIAYYSKQKDPPEAYQVGSAASQ